MKRNRFVLLPAVIIIIGIFIGCNQSNKETFLIPKDAVSVFHLNTGSLSSKLSWKEIAKTDWFKRLQMHHSSDTLVQNILQDPERSGVDTKAGFAIFNKPTAAHSGFTGFTGMVKDGAAFESFNKNLTGKNVSKENDLNIISFENNGVVVWNEKKFLYLIDQSALPGPRRHHMADTSVSPVDYVPTLSNYAKTIFNYKRDSLLADDDRFASLISNKGDVHFWYNVEHAMDYSVGMSFIPLLKMDVYLKQSAYASTLNFENGKILLETKYYTNSEMRDILKKYQGEELNKNFVQQIPSDSVLGVLAANFKPEGIKEILKLGGLDGLINGFLGEHHLTMDEIVAAMKGDLLIAITPAVKEPGKSLLASKNVLFAVTIGNKDAFNKLMDAFKKMTEGGPMQMHVYMSINNGIFAIGSSQAQVDEFTKGNKRNFSFLSKMSGHPVGGYADLHMILSTFTMSLKDSSTQNALDAAMATWKDVVFTGGEFENGGLTQKVEVNLQDQNTNSLKQINQFIELVSKGRGRTANPLLNEHGKDSLGSKARPKKGF